MPEAKLTRGEYIVSGDAFNRYATGGVVEGVTCSADEPPMLSSCLYGSSQFLQQLGALLQTRRPLTLE